MKPMPSSNPAMGRRVASARGARRRTARCAHSEQREESGDEPEEVGWERRRLGEREQHVAEGDDDHRERPEAQLPRSAEPDERRRGAHGVGDGVTGAIPGSVVEVVVDVVVVVVTPRCT